MAITQCNRGHLYDPTVYPTCPYCGGGGNMIDFESGYGGAAGGTAAPAGYGRSPVGYGQGGYGGEAPGATVPSGGYGVSPGAYAPAAPVAQAGGYGSPAASGGDAAPNRTVPVRHEAVPDGGSAAGNRTVAPESYRRRQEEENKTVAAFQRNMNIEREPVVGWLACAAGTNRGKSFELYAKINTIGRSSENDVCIQGDDTISRRNHARLAYDPRHNNFRLIPEESTNNIYLNDEPVYTPVPLAAYDVIELGESRMIFVPLCCDRFRWDAENGRP